MFDYSKLDQPEILSFIFHPYQVDRTVPVDGTVDIDFNVEETVVLSCRFHQAGKEAPVIIYFHGNGEIVSDYDAIGQMYAEAGMNILVTDYRGYGWSSGTPSVGTMLNDAHFLLIEAVKWLQQNEFSRPLFVMGRSLGSACAIDLCHGNKEMIKGLVIESGFCDTLPLLKTIGLDLEHLDIEENDCFNHRQKIDSITIPTLIMHGSHDFLIPLPEAERLQSFSGARQKEFHIVPGADHNSMISTGGPFYFSTIKTFIDKVTGSSSWRKRRKSFKSVGK